jgi:hypothetical protein
VPEAVLVAGLFTVIVVPEILVTIVFAGRLADTIPIPTTTPVVADNVTVALLLVVLLVIVPDAIASVPTGVRPVRAF